jgi:serine phosphatase RsbU (regulator of sigma subunit)/anti-sigma regulatory factor (Ser/Thr protein kinase)
MLEVPLDYESPSPPSPVELMTQMAVALHGSSPLAEKVAWAVDALRSLTGAVLAGYLDLTGHESTLTPGSGAVTFELDELVRPAVARFVMGRGEADELRGDKLRRDRRWREFLERASLPASAEVVATTVRSADGGARGVLLGWAPDAEDLDPDGPEAVRVLAAHLGVAVDNERRLTVLTEIQEVQREVVHQLQEAVRPPMPAVEADGAAELGVHHLPADPSVPSGGDLHDWLVLPDGDIYLAVVDIMGKGVAATKDAVAVTHALRLLVLDGYPIEGLIARADALLTRQNPDLVATVVVARYRPADGRVVLAGGGHPPPLVVTADGDVRLVSVPGIAVGWPGAGSSEVVELTLGRNDTLVLYTDGLIESTKDVLVGLDNLTRAAGQIARYPSAHVARALVERSLSGAKRRDDSLALVLRRRTPPPADTAGHLAPFEYRFSPLTATIPLGRHLFSDWLEQLSVNEAERDDLLLVASELASNAVRHASGAPTALALRAWAEADSIVVEVEDDGPGFEMGERYYDDETPDTELENGRGLYVVEALSDEVSVRREGERTLVRAVRRAVLPVP